MHWVCRKLNCFIFEKFIIMQRKAFDWFLGENDLHLPLYDFRTKGCYDGLMRNDVNLNQGAESALSFLLGLLTVIESYMIFDKIDEEELVKFKKEYTQRLPIKKRNPSKKTQIKEISTKIKAKNIIRKTL